MLIDPDSFRREAEALCRAVAPKDLDGVALYPLLQSEMPPDLRCGGSCGGYVDPLLDIAARDVIGSRWHGRGVCFVLNDLHPADHKWSNEDARGWLLAVAVHELLHAVSWPGPIVWPTTLRPPVVRTSVAEFVARVAQPVEMQRPDLTRMHDARFVRSVAHALWRAEQAGVELCETELLGCGYHLTSFVRSYFQLAASEVVSMTDATFADILASPMPPGFEELWQDDTRFIRGEGTTEIARPD